MSEDLKERGLSTKEINKVNRNRKEALPLYFSKGAGEEVSITRDFESFLILLDDSVKNSAIEWIQRIKELSVDRKDRDELLAMAIIAEESDSKDKYDVLDELLNEFYEFIYTFRVEKFVNVPEVGTFLEDLQNQILESVIFKDRMYHLKTLTSNINKKYGVDAVDENSVKQLESWSTSFNEYRGTE